MLFLFFLQLVSAQPAQVSISASNLLDGTSTHWEQARDIAYFPNGDAVIVGGTSSSNFNTMNGFDKIYNDGTTGTSMGSFKATDAFVTRINAQGKIIWSSFLGGPNYDRAYAVEIDSNGDIIIAGRAGDRFPTTAGALQATFAGDSSPNTGYGKQDGFVAKIAGNGSKVYWATYVGGPGPEFIRDIDLDSKNNIHLGISNAKNLNAYVNLFPNALQKLPSGGIDSAYMVLNSIGTKIQYATYVGGNGTEPGTPTIRIAADDSAYLLYQDNSTNAPVKNAFQAKLGGGTDLMLAKFNPDYSLQFLTYFGGTQNELNETHNLAIDLQGNVIIAGASGSVDLPGLSSSSYQSVHGGKVDVFVAVLSANGQLLRSTLVGGLADERVEGVTTDFAGNIFFTGSTKSQDFPLSAMALDRTLGGIQDGFVGIITNDLQNLIYSSFIGGAGIDEVRSCAIDGQGRLAIAGMIDKNSTTFPLVNATDSIINGTYAAYYTLFDLFIP